MIDWSSIVGFGGACLIVGLLWWSANQTPRPAGIHRGHKKRARETAEAVAAFVEAHNETDDANAAASPGRLAVQGRPNAAPDKGCVRIGLPLPHMGHMRWALKRSLQEGDHLTTHGFVATGQTADLARSRLNRLTQGQQHTLRRVREVVRVECDGAGYAWIDIVSQFGPYGPLVRHLEDFLEAMVAWDEVDLAQPEKQKQLPSASLSAAEVVPPSVREEAPVVSVSPEGAPVPVPSRLLFGDASTKKKP